MDLPMLSPLDPPLDPPLDLDPSDVAEGHLELRYDDVTQDGFVRTVALTHGLGKAFWRQVAPRRFARLGEQGIVPILTRLCSSSGDGPVGLEAGLAGVSRYALASAPAEGAVDAIVLCVWLTLRAPCASVYGPPPPRAGDELVVGRVYAEHVFTKPFAARGERRVVELDAPGLPRVPTRRVTRATVEQVVALPNRARWTSDWLVDPAPAVFGLDHSDSNQHVNSLVYPQLFRDAALRAWRGAHNTRVPRVVHDELVFRKPCFAGEHHTTVLRTYEREGRLGAALMLCPDVPLGIETNRLAGVSPSTAARLEAAG